MPSLLVIEDEVVLSRQLQRALSSAGHDVRLVNCGEDGVREAQSAHVFRPKSSVLSVA